MTPRPTAADLVCHDRPLRRGAAPLAAVEHAGIRSASIGRDVVENVTYGDRRFDIPSPMPYTRVNASIEPNGPHRSRLSTMRAASAGPIHGNASIVMALAVSRSTRIRAVSRAVCDAVGVVRVSLTRGLTFVFDAPFFDLARTSRTRAIWESSASISAAVATGRASRALTTRATTPRAATAATTASALRSPAVVGIAPKLLARSCCCITAPTHAKRFHAVTASGTPHGNGGIDACHAATGDECNECRPADQHGGNRQE